ncbi:MAG: CCA tRNA nucleotidyltransferase [Rhodospirillales bacterium]|nr:CCA tRNA nucleotidyltransferase [Rhodospirillales bacterium]
MADVPQKPTGKLPPLPWMTAPETRAIFAALEAGGKEARFVGGCVRNAVFGIEVKDIDIATPEKPERVMELLEAAGIKAIPTGIEHGTVTAIIDSHPYEITTLRVDVENHGRHASVAFTDDWLADALRRDFTINTLSSTLDGDIYDPLSGIEDIALRWVRFVGIARERIEEDLLRLLRFFRFQAMFGNRSIDKDALAACRLLAPRLNELSAERVRSELFRILEAPNPADTLILMKGERILEHFLPEAENFGRLRMIYWLETTAINVPNVKPDPLRRLTATLSNDPAGHEALAQRLRLSKKQSARMAVMTGDLNAPTPEMSELERDLALFDLGSEGFRDLVLLQWAQEMSVEPRRRPERSLAWLALIDAADTWTQPIFPIKGKDALDLGLEHGPTIGTVLDAVETWWRDGGFKAERELCLGQLKKVIEDKT